MITPYYEHAGITIYHGDSREILEQWEGQHGVKSFDLLLTDPPYGLGMGLKHKRGGSGASRTMTGFFAGQARPVTTDYGRDSHWDCLMLDVVLRARAICRQQMIFGGNYYTLPPARCWLVWDKDNGETDFADCELVWTNLDSAVRKLLYRWNGMLQQPGVPHEYRLHPSQKPEAVMRWCLMQAPKAQTVFDPFMGSGTTLVAAKRLGKSATGIEGEERYCEIAAERLAQEAFVFGESA